MAAYGVSLSRICSQTELYYRVTMKLKEYMEIRNNNVKAQASQLTNGEIRLLKIDRSKSGWINLYSELDIDPDLLSSLCKIVLSSDYVRSQIKVNIRNHLNREYDDKVKPYSSPCLIAWAFILP